MQMFEHPTDCGVVSSHQTACWKIEMANVSRMLSHLYQLLFLIGPYGPLNDSLKKQTFILHFNEINRNSGTCREIG